MDAPLRLTLWLEPIITIATIGRLHLDLGWPSEQLCMQPKTWAFDFAVYEPCDASTEYIAGEVKKNRRELDRMIELMQGYARVGVVDEPAEAERNAWRKWRTLKDRRPPLFWAVGPDDYTRLFAVDYPEAPWARSARSVATSWLVHLRWRRSEPRHPITSKRRRAYE